MKSILVVDDEATILRGLAVMVRSFSEDVRVRTAGDGLEALESIRADKPDVLLTDIRMPKLDGIGLCERLHEWRADIPIVVISGYSDFQYAQKCLSFGVKQYLLKPVIEDDLYPVLTKLLEAPVQPLISLSSYEHWLEKAETAVWSLKESELEAAMAEWRGLAELVPMEQLRALVRDCLALLVKRLHAREQFRFDWHGGQDVQPATVEEAYQAIRTALYELSGQVALRRGGGQKDVLVEAMNYIDEHISREMTLEEVADKVGLNATYFSSLFKRTTQQSFTQYKTKKRIELAKRLLEQPHYRVTDIAMEVGYDSYPHFVKIFKAWTGFTPSEFRSSLGIK